MKNKLMGKLFGLLTQWALSRVTGRLYGKSKFTKAKKHKKPSFARKHLPQVFGFLKNRFPRLKT
jgi:hypothetical protein